MRTDKIYLVGFMGAGKSTVAEALGTRLEWQVADIDASGRFSSAEPVTLMEGPNLIEVIASDLAGGIETMVLTVVYIP